MIYDDVGNPILGDGVCTGFPSHLGPWDWTVCCAVHDLGGSNGQLLDCISAQVPAWAQATVAFAIALMILLHPAYEWMQRRGWVK